jgi:hypothetical protein
VRLIAFQISFSIISGTELSELESSLSRLQRSLRRVTKKSESDPSPEDWHSGGSPRDRAGLLRSSFPLLGVLMIFSLKTSPESRSNGMAAAVVGDQIHADRKHFRRIKVTS